MHLSDFRIPELYLPENAKEIKVKTITSDSRNSSKDCMFIAIKGNNQDGHNFIDEAISAGASNILVDYKYKNDTKIPVSKSKNVRRALALISAIYYNDQPNTIAAVTGTNGKTSVCSFLTQIWEKSNFSAASLGTLGLITTPKLNSLKIKNGLTTLDPVNLHSCISHLKLNGINRLALEASSHGLEQHRLDGVNIPLACFTNLSHDHLDYHKSFEDYKKQKFRLFKELLQDGGSAIINIDDKVGEELIKTIKDRNINIITYGKSKNADWKIDEIFDIENYKTIKISAYGKSYIISTALNSRFHVENAVAAACLSFASGIPIENSLHSIKDLKPPEGRMQELISRKGTKIYIDFCHTPDALKNILKEKSSNKSKIFLVIGCGGNRDIKKRKIIGKIASKYTFKTFVTNDNPRDESPEKIRAEILKGMLKYKNNLTGIENRKKAIKTAMKEARAEDIVIIAGKGHEKYQIFKDKKIPHNDFEFCKSLIQNENNQ
tara:strand:- start:110 stop:1585 length:1476 start_codon:yes stop_codon:yes gene_type:complete